MKLGESIPLPPAHRLQAPERPGDLPTDSEASARAVDSVDLARFQAGRTFTPDNARALAALATMAYADPEDQRAHLAQQPAVRAFHFLDSKNNAGLGLPDPDTGTQVSVVETDQAMLVAASGTTRPGLTRGEPGDRDDWKDAFHDLAGLPTPNYAGTARVPWGFKKAADGIWGQLRPLLEIARATHKQVHLAGHSLGAAVALMLAERMTLELGTLPRSVVRTGGPDCGWADQEKHLENLGVAQRTFNFVNNCDPIPFLLPRGVTVGTRIYFDRHGEASLEPGPHKLDRALGAADLALRRQGPLQKHLPEAYNELLGDPDNDEVLRKLARRLATGRTSHPPSLGES